MLILFKGWSDTIFEVHFAEKKAILQGKLSCKLWGKIVALKKLLWFFFSKSDSSIDKSVFKRGESFST